VAKPETEDFPVGVAVGIGAAVAVAVGGAVTTAVVFNKKKKEAVEPQETSDSADETQGE
jgi:hypothetical protein